MQSYLKKERQRGEERVSDKELLEDICQQLRSITKLLVVGLMAGKNQKEQISLLSFAGFQPKEIAKMLDTTPNTVSVMLTRLKKKKG